MDTAEARETEQGPGTDTLLLLHQRNQNSGFGEKKGRDAPTDFWVAGFGQDVSSQVTRSLRAPGARRGPAVLRTQGLIPGPGAREQVSWATAWPHTHSSIRASAPRPEEVCA